MENYFDYENKITSDIFNLDEIFEFQKNNVIEIIKECDNEYHCLINQHPASYAISLTPMHALVMGIKKHKELNGH